MKRMYPPGYHHSGFVATHSLGHMMYGYTLLVPTNQRVLNKLSKEHNISDPRHIVMLSQKRIVVITGRAHCFHDNIYYAHLASVRFEHSVCHGSLMTTIYKYIKSIRLNFELF